MRTGLLILLSPFVVLAIFAILSINAHSIDDTISGSADQLIDASNGNLQPFVDTRFATNPQASRKAWGIGNNANSAIPSSTVSPRDSMAEAESASAAVNQDQTENLQNTTETTSAQTSPVSPATTASGSWSFELRDSTLKDAVLTLFESRDAIFGTGSLKNGNDSIPVTASGFLNGDLMNLDIMTLGSINLYRLSLTTNGDSASGNYTAFSADGQSWTGSAEGIRSAPQT